MNSSILSILEAIDDKFIDEDNTTASMDPLNVPGAFAKKTKKPNSGGSYDVSPEPSERFFKKIYEQVESVDYILHEISYKDFKVDNTRSESQKINQNIAEINKKLYEVERLIDHASKLKVETESDQGVFWKGTVSRFEKINNRLSRLTNKIREMNS